MNIGLIPIIALFLQHFMIANALDHVSNSTIDLLERCISNSVQTYNYTIDELDQLFIVLTEQREYEEDGRDIVLALCMETYGKNATIIVVENVDSVPVYSDFPNDGLLDHDAWDVIRSKGLRKEDYAISASVLNHVIYPFSMFVLIYVVIKAYCNGIYESLTLKNNLPINEWWNEYGGKLLTFYQYF